MPSSKDTPVVLTCGGRTRGILGAQILVEAGLPNPVYWLEDGTAGWRMAGYELAPPVATPPPPSPPPHAVAAAIAARFGVTTVDIAAVEGLLRAADRTGVVIDVRERGEYVAGHLPGARNVPGGELVQDPTRHLATRRATIVLVDDGSGSDAIPTAAWLGLQCVGDVVVAVGPPPSLVGGPEPVESGTEPARGPTISPDDVAERLTIDRDVLVVDLASSTRYRAGHIPGAWYGSRARWSEALERLPPASSIVVTCPDGDLAVLGAADLVALGRRAVALAGGTEGWTGAGQELEAGTERYLVQPRDSWGPPPGIEGLRAWFARHHRWSDEVVAKIRRDAVPALLPYPS
jgi:rhodanese-related sulfurtransferase